MCKCSPLTGALISDRCVSFCTDLNIKPDPLQMTAALALKCQLDFCTLQAFRLVKGWNHNKWATKRMTRLIAVTFLLIAAVVAYAALVAALIHLIMLALQHSAVKKGEKKWTTLWSLWWIFVVSEAQHCLGSLVQYSFINNAYHPHTHAETVLIISSELSLFSFLRLERKACDVSPGNERYHRGRSWPRFIQHIV